FIGGAEGRWQHLCLMHLEVLDASLARHLALPVLDPNSRKARRWPPSCNIQFGTGNQWLRRTRNSCVSSNVKLSLVFAVFFACLLPSVTHNFQGRELYTKVKRLSQTKG